jgi:hypothetical protein
MINPAETIYEQEKNKYEGQLKVLRKKQSMLGWFRLSILILFAVLAFYLFNFSLLAGWIAVIAGVAAFLVVVSIDTDNNRKIDHLKLLVRINQEELDTLNGVYDYKYDGINFLPALHDYAFDLDVFGKSSLYQFINRGYTEQGRELLASNFLTALPAKKVVERHEAIKELAPQYQWRQQLQAYAMQSTVTKATQLKTEEWLGLPEKHFTGKNWVAAVWIYSIIAVAGAAAAALGYISSGIFFVIVSALFFCVRWPQ